MRGKGLLELRGGTKRELWGDCMEIGRALMAITLFTQYLEGKTMYHMDLKDLIVYGFKGSGVRVLD